MAEPQNDLKNLPAAAFPDDIPSETLLRLPREVAHEFAAVFFEETDDALSLGVAHPELLKDNVNQALAVLEGEVGKKIVLFRITPEQLKRALKQYAHAQKEVATSEPVSDSAPSSSEGRPPQYTEGSSVPAELLSRIPTSYAKEHRLLAVDQSADGVVWFATDRDNPSLRVAAELIARRNRFTEKIVVVSRGEFERLLHDSATKPVTKPVTEQEPVDTDKPKSTEDVSKPKSPEKDITEPEYKGTILTGEVEKPGFAGLFQRAGQILSGKAANDVAAATAATVTTGTVAASVAADAAHTSTESQSHKEVVKKEAIKKEAPADHADMEKPAKSESGDAVPLSVPVVASAMADDTPTVSEAGVSDPGADEDTGNDHHEDALFARPVTDVKQLQTIVRAGSIPRIVAGIINLAVERKSSDVHLEPFGDELLVRYRVDGQLNEVLRLPMSVHAAIVSRIKILSKLKLDESRIPQDGRFDVTVSGNREIDIRVSTLPTVHGEKVVMRLLDKSEGIYTLEKLGLTGDGFNRLIGSIKQAYGVVLSTGPTGSGKTTTLYAILQRVATTNVNVITLEDPVEYEMKGINQSQIKPKIGFTFAEGLRSVLRQDPNIIMVGEVRDGETAAMVTHAALTGHLVLSTLHTNNAAGALPRMINMGIEPFLITSAMNSVIGQRLVRRICPECKEKFDLPPAVRHDIDGELEKIRQQNPKEATRIPNDVVFYRSNGCDKCSSGYRGRVGLFEVLLMSETIEDLAVRKAPAIEIERAAVSEGMLTMKQDGILKVLEGTTTLDEVLRETSSR